MPTQEPAGGLPESSQDWAGLIGALQQDQELAVQALDGIEAERRPLALASMTGDRKAAQQVADLNRREAELRAIVATRRAALEDAEARRQASAEREREAMHAARREEARVLKGELLAVDAEVDGDFRRLAVHLTKRLGIARQLTAYGVTHRQLVNKTRLLAAAGHAGLNSDLLDIGRAQRGLHAPLAEIDAKMLATLLDNVPAAMPEPPPVVRAVADEPALHFDPGALSAEEAAEDALARKLLREGPEA
jgi:hypothetical protein